MRVVLDTNVFMSGIFFRGAPSQILHAWRAGKIVPVLSVDILGEYQKVGRALASRWRWASPDREEAP